MYVRPEHLIVFVTMFVSSVKGLFVPSPNLLLSHHRWLLLTGQAVEHFDDHSAFIEPMFYLGPILVLVALFAKQHWSSLKGRLLIYLLLLFWLLTLGPVGSIGGRHFPLPWWILWKMPLMHYAIPVRVGLTGYLVVGLIVAAFLDDLRSQGMRAMVALLVVLAILPDIPFTAFAAARVDTPRFFLTSAYKSRLPRNAIALVLPFGMSANSMLWQATTGMDFRMADGWTAGNPAALGSFDPYEQLELDATTPKNPETAKALLSKFQVDTIVIPVQWSAAAAQWSAILNEPAERVEDVMLLKVPASFRSAVPPTTATPLAR
jgi:hypothetical protein